MTRIQAEHAQLLRLLTTQLQRGDGFELVFLFGNDERSLDWLREELNKVLLRMHKTLQRFTSTTEVTLAETIKDILNKSAIDTPAHALWVFAGSNPELSSKLLGRMNERRQQLTEQACPIYICLPSASALQLATLAPDLWSIRSLALDVPAFAPDPLALQPQRSAVPARADLIYYPLWQFVLQKLDEGKKHEDAQVNVQLGILALNELLKQSRITQAGKVIQQIQTNFPSLAEGAFEGQYDQGYFQQLLGDWYRISGNRSAALLEYEKSLKISEKLAASDPKNSDWQRDLSVSYEKVAGILEVQGEREKALLEYEKSLAIREKLAASDPKNSDWQRDLSVSFNKVAGILEAQGEREKALLEYEKSLAIREKLAASDPKNSDWQIDLVVSYYKLGSLHFNAKNSVESAYLLSKSLLILEQLNGQNALTAAQKQWPAMIQQLLDRAHTNL